LRFGATFQALHAACHKDFIGSLNVKSLLMIGGSHHSMLPEATVHALVLHWVWVLMPFNAKPALAVRDLRS